MTTVRTCLWFDGDGLDAARVYTALIPGSSLDDIVPAPANTPDADAGAPLVVNFTLSGQRYQALNGGPQFPHTEAASIVLECATQQEADRYWYALSEGGSEGQCGWLKDQFGVSWQIVPLPAMRLIADPNTGAAAMRAMLRMSRIDADEMARAAGR